MSIKSDSNHNCDNFFECVRNDTKYNSNRKKEIISNYAYIEWLFKFTEIYNEFSTDTWLYKKNEISSQDSKLVDDLRFLFDVVVDYYKNNFLDFYISSVIEEVHIKFNDIGFSIGFSNIQGVSNYVRRSVVTSKHIDFEDIMNNILLDERIKKTNEMLEALKRSLKQLKEFEVPYDEIENIVKNIYLKDLYLYK